MPQFLRDQKIENLNIDENSLRLINDFFIDRINQQNNLLGNTEEENKQLFLMTYIIRFDNKGYKILDFNELLKFYNQANEVERVLFIIESLEYIKSEHLLGANLELRLDSKDTNNCFLSSSSDDRNWVDSSFTGVLEILQKFRNKNKLIRNDFTQLLIQIFGVIFGFIISLWASKIIEPYISLENAFVIIFLFVFLIFSNSWTFIFHQIGKALNYAFPNVRFKRKGREKIHWLFQALIGGLVVAFSLFILRDI